MNSLSINPGFQTAQSKLAFTGGSSVKLTNLQKKVIGSSDVFIRTSMNRSSDELSETIKNNALYKKSFLQRVIDLFSKKTAPKVIEK